MRRDEVRNDVLVLLMKGFMYHSMACVLYNLASEKPLQKDLHLLILYLPLFLFAIVRRKCKKISIFILFHAVVSGVFLIVFPGLEERMIIGGCTAFIAAVSVYNRLKNGDTQEECPSITSLVWFLLFYLAAGQNNRVQAMKICYYEVFLFLILFVAFKSLTSADMFLEANERIENLPVKQIKRINQMLLGIFILFFIAGMLLAPYLPVNSLMNGIGRLLLLLIRGIIMLFARFFSGETPQTKFSGEGVKEAMPVFETGETSMLAVVVEQVIMTAIYVLLAVGAGYLLIKGLYGLYRRFYEQNENTTDKSEFLWENMAIKARTERKRQKRELWAGRSANEKIRHLYKRSIQKQFGKKTDLPTAMTLTELEHLIAQKNAKNAKKEEMIPGPERKERIRLYQKARYSQHECDKQELEAMRKNIKTF